MLFLANALTFLFNFLTLKMRLKSYYLAHRVAVKIKWDNLGQGTL